MIALHAIWRSGMLHLWGESSTLPRKATPLRGRRPKKPKPRPHPFAVDGGGLRAAVAVLAEDLSSADSKPAELCLTLPTGSAGPLASPELIDETEGSDGSAKQLAPWTVTCMKLKPLPALSFLADLPATPPPGVVPGASLRYWSDASLMVLELVAGQLFVPDLTDCSGGLRAIWRPVPGAGGTADRIRQLAAAMPPVCRAAVDVSEARGKIGQERETTARGKGKYKSKRISGTHRKDRPGRGGGARGEGEDKDKSGRDRGTQGRNAEVNENGGMAPDTLVSDFLESTLDATVRQSLTDLALLPRRRHKSSRGGSGSKGPAAVPIPERWLEALRSTDPQVRGASRETAALAKLVRAWTGHLETPTGGGAFRTCFRLEPPVDDAATLDPESGIQVDGGSDRTDSGSGRAARHAGSDERAARRTKSDDGDARHGKSGNGAAPAATPEGSSDWAVTFHLQARDDPSLLIDAAQVWRERSGTLTYLKRRFENPQERLLADLGRASRLFPELDKGLRSARPEVLTLDSAAAYAFLRESAPLLEQSGFGVLVPSWWRKPSSRLGLRLRVRPARTTKSQTGAGMGMETLLDFNWEVALGDEKLSIKDFERLAKLKVPLVRVRGQWVELRREDLNAAARLIEEHRQSGGISLAEAMRLGIAADAAETGLPVVGMEAEGWVAPMLAGEARPERVQAPRKFQGKLRPYQRVGLSWLAFLSHLGLGSCLADDMGLGKTIQLIALLLNERSGKAAPGPTLIVCPMSVVGNWQREVERFAPSLDVMVHHGTERLTGAKFSREAKKHDLVITTYALALRDLKHLKALTWHRIVLDEAQNIKNPDAKQTRALRALKADRRVAMTGTPVENRLSELWSIMDFLNPGFLGSASAFRRSFALPIERYRDGERSERLRRLVGPFVLRRLKTDKTVIKDLPQKLEMKVLCNLTAEQASLYEVVVKEMVEAIQSAKGIERRGLVLATLMKLKQVCNHPALFLGDGSRLEGRSGKLARLGEMLEEVLAEGDRALVFTQFSKMGDLLKDHLQETLGREVLFLHGGTAKKARDRMVARFQGEGEAPPVFLISLKAGGLGLNLTAANHVFHFDRWWNPAVENQATDRAYRIGQRKRVQVHKYVSVGTLEERIDRMIERKRELAELVIGTGEGWITEMSTDKLRELFALSREAVAEG